MVARHVTDVRVQLRCETCRELTTVLLDGRCPTCHLITPAKPRSFAFVLIADPREEKP